MRLTEYQATEGGIPYVVVKDEQEALQKLAAYEDAEEQGRLWVLPEKLIRERMEILSYEEAEAALKGFKMNNKFWCIWQDEDTNGVYCTAHIHEDRVLNCPYKNLEERQRANYPCQDYRPMKGVRKDGT